MAKSPLNPSARSVFYWVWVGLSFISFLPIAFIACFGSQQAKAVVSYCVSPHEPCPFCGMTRGFSYLLDGNISAANELNELTLWYFGATTLSFLLAVISLIILAFKKVNTRDA
ncbi:MAG: DUF2752 domain-containing protein [Akkermansia sp.]|nr:DUF2752 domain-containing protein [Akkermansia sp.]